MVGLENFELAGIKSYTRFWGLLMFGSYSVINVIVLLNLLIAMMSNSYALIVEHSDTEWKFARTRLWMSYFEEGATIPPPFNIIPTPKLLLKLLGLRKKDKIKKMKMKDSIEKDEDVRYTAVMRALVWRYVSAMHRKMDDEPVTEDDVNELKGDISALKYELLEVFEKNGYDVSFTNRKEKAVLGKRMKMWERRLMKDFQVTVSGTDDMKPENEDGLAKFRRIARMAIASSSSSKWDQTLAAAGVPSQIGRSRSRSSFKNQQNLKRAMDEAKKLAMRSPIPEGSRGASPVSLPVTPGHHLMELIKDFSTEAAQLPSPLPRSPARPVTPSAGLLSIGAGPQSPSAASVCSRVGSPSPSKIKMPSRGPTTSRSSSPMERPTSPTPEKEPSPLVSKRTLGDSPPKVIKRKPAAPDPDIKSTETRVEASIERSSEDIAVARPVAHEIKPAGGALLPPPPPTVKAKAPTAPTMEITPSTPIHTSSPPSPIRPTSPKSPVISKPPSPPKTKAPSKPSTPSKSPTKLTSPIKSPAPTRPASPTKTPSRSPTPKSAPVKPNVKLTSRSPTPTGGVLRLSSTSSTEQLIPPPSPSPLRPGQKIEEVRTIKRQPKTGWL